MADIVEYHRKYRPSRLSEYIGNANIVNAALSFLTLEDKKPQVILLSGHSGCGKTTFARLLCSCYSCEHPLPNGDACGECDSCKEFAHYIETGDNDGLMNITEVDVTTDGGKKATEDLIEQMNEPSYDGRWKCFILDECHLLTNAAQSSLLKPIEEPPEKVLICLCTTNPEKLLPTITSRCMYKFRVQKPKREELINYLSSICVKEGIRAERKGLSLIATKGDLVPRNSLIELQNVVRARGEVTYEAVAETLEIVSEKYYFTFYKLLTDKTLVTYKYVNFIHEVVSNLNLTDFLNGLIDFTLRGIYVYNSVPIEGLDESELTPYKELFSRFSPSELVFLMSFLTGLRGDQDMEIKLLQLGYTGIQNCAIANSGTTPDMSALSSLDDLKTSASGDADAGSALFNAKTEMTADERLNLVREGAKATSLDEIIETFHAKSLKTGGK